MLIHHAYCYIDADAGAGADADAYAEAGADDAQISRLTDELMLMLIRRADLHCPYLALFFI